ncbi:hypothetical protein IWX49DRAFT_78855 [Phyllosticta citricarpa]|uniref:Secreted protein n=1 Tax=Phyllosticta citricarpa TaxID=55181 RepID=A0ABR1MPQ5_9PEZI
MCLVGATIIFYFTSSSFTHFLHLLSIDNENNNHHDAVHHHCHIRKNHLNQSNLERRLRWPDTVFLTALRCTAEKERYRPTMSTAVLDSSTGRLTLFYRRAS